MNLPSSIRNFFVPAAIVTLLLLSAVVSARNIFAQNKTTMNKTFDYPTAKKVDQIDDYHGVKVEDPYRWLENPDSADSRAWIEEENKLTFGFLNEVPERAKIKERLTKLWNYEKYSQPFKEGDRYFYFKNDGLQNQNVL
jgi:prolyl oligopeptidase